MARNVDEIMNRELFALRPGEPVESSVDYFFALGLTAAPVVDEKGVPIGFVSLRDVFTRKQGSKVQDRMTTPVVTVPIGATIEQAARILVERDLHHAPVVDGNGRAIGVVSLLDVTKGLLGLPVGHPPAFPHYDRETGLVWTDDMVLAAESAEAAPDGPGLLALVQGGAGSREAVVWVESCFNVRTRVFELLDVPQTDSPHLAGLLARRGLRYRAASVPDQPTRKSALRSMLSEIEHLPAPAR